MSDRGALPSGSRQGKQADSPRRSGAGVPLCGDNRHSLLSCSGWLEGCNGALPQERRFGEGVAGRARMPEMPTKSGGKSKTGLKQRR